LFQFLDYNSGDVQIKGNKFAKSKR